MIIYKLIYFILDKETFSCCIGNKNEYLYLKESILKIKKALGNLY